MTFTRPYLVLLFSFILVACEEEKDDDISFSRSGSTQNSAIDMVNTLFPDLYQQYLLAAGDGRTCAYYQANALSFGLRCWGRAIESGTYLKRNNTNRRTVSIGQDHVCTRFGDLNATKIGCEGSNGAGQALEPSSTEGAASGFWSASPVMVASGDVHNCLLDNYGVYCWGDNPSGQTNVPTLSDPVWIAAGGNTSCAWEYGSGISCWGDNSQGQTQVPETLNTITHLDVGSGFACAIADGSVTCWGNLRVPTELALTNPVFISTGANHVCVIDEENSVKAIKCFGNNDQGQLNVPDFSSESYEVISVSAGSGHTCATYAYTGYEYSGGSELNQPYSGSYCWGKNDQGQTQVPQSACLGYHASATEPSDRFCPH